MPFTVKYVAVVLEGTSKSDSNEACWSAGRIAAWGVWQVVILQQAYTELVIARKLESDPFRSKSKRGDNYGSAGST